MADFELVKPPGAVFLGLRFCASRKGGTGGGGWVHLKGANSMAASGLGCRRPWLALSDPLSHEWA